MSILDRLTEDERQRLAREKEPQWSAPMLATLTHDYFDDPDWVYERKLDGERVIGVRNGRSIRLSSRNEEELSPSYPEIHEALARQHPAGTDFVVDGEIVAFEGRVTSFSRLQARMRKSDPQAARATGIAVFYYLFDLLHVDGYDLTELPLRTRKNLLRASFDWRDPLRWTPHRNSEGRQYFRQACRKGWEGVIAKRADSPYRHSRSADWRKFKCVHQQEFVIGGYTDPAGERTHFGALLLGHHEDGRLVYSGKVGTGFDRDSLQYVGNLLESCERTSSPFEGTDQPSGDPHYVRPDLVCEIAFTEWTKSGRLRHPRFLGLRRDKDAADVIRESSEAVTA